MGSKVPAKGSLSSRPSTGLLGAARPSTGLMAPAKPTAVGLRKPLQSSRSRIDSQRESVHPHIPHPTEVPKSGPSKAMKTERTNGPQTRLTIHVPKAEASTVFTSRSNSTTGAAQHAFMQAQQQLLMHQQSHPSKIMTQNVSQYLGSKGGIDYRRDSDVQQQLQARLLTIKQPSETQIPRT